MPVVATNPAPYAPASAILDIIDRYRNRGLARPFTAEVLVRAGVSDSLIPRVMQALQTLDLIDDIGNPTETMEALRRAPEPEYKNQLAAWINAAYADVMLFVNASDDETAIRDAFRGYNPVGQQSRMVSLFMGLCRAAGMRTDDQSNAKPRPLARRSAAPTGVSAVRKNSAITPKTGGIIFGGGIPAPIPAPIAGLLSKLPPEHGTWTSTEREKFITTFEAVLDFCFTVDDEPKASAGEE
jgi:hypothetical protein